MKETLSPMPADVAAKFGASAKSFRASMIELGRSLKSWAASAEKCWAVKIAYSLDEILSGRGPFLDTLETFDSYRRVNLDKEQPFQSIELIHSRSLVLQEISKVYFLKNWSPQDISDYPPEKLIRKLIEESLDVETAIEDLLKECYAHFTGGRDIKVALVLAWNEHQVIVECPYCKTQHTHQYKSAPHVGFPIIYDTDCQGPESCEYRAVFPYEVHSLTKPYDFQRKFPGGYWITVGQGLTDSYSISVNTSTPVDSNQTEELDETIDSVAQHLMRIDLSEYDFEKIHSQIADMTRALRLIDRAVRKYELGKFQINLWRNKGVHDWKDGRRPAVYLICTENLQENKGRVIYKGEVLSWDGIKDPNRMPCLLRQGKPYKDIVAISGYQSYLKWPSTSQPDCHEEGWWNEENSTANLKWDDDGQLGKWTEELARELNLPTECSLHTERKMVVYYLIINGIWVPKSHTKLSISSGQSFIDLRNKDQSLWGRRSRGLTLVLSKNPCSNPAYSGNDSWEDWGCLQFLNEVMEKFDIYILWKTPTSPSPDHLKSLNSEHFDFHSLFERWSH